jgi:hypothetical protein
MDFSERMSICETKKVMQIYSIDSDLRRSIWNRIYIYLESWKYIKNDKYIQAWWIAKKFLKQDLDEFHSKNPYSEYHSICDNSPYDISIFRNELKEFIYKREWYEVCELMEYIVKRFPNTHYQECFNEIFEEERFWYTFINRELAPITNENEIQEIESTSQLINESAQHFQNALQYFSEKSNPRYEQVVEESIKWIEALLREITWKYNLTLWESINHIKRNKKNNNYDTLWQWLEKIWWFVSNNIRHADKPDWIIIDFATAKFVLVFSSTLANYIHAVSDEIKK